jgi:pilus assembly protein CpaC
LGSQQVMLQVRVAEVTQQALKNLGVSLFTGGTGSGNWIGRTTTEQFAAPALDIDKGTTTFSDLLNLFLFNSKYNVGAVISALQTTGHFQSLAEPDLIAYNGREASFLVGGQIPVPVVQGLTNAITIEWKEYGIRLTFTPTIAGDVIRLKVEPEVSALDYTHGITLQGYNIPALTTRRAKTEVELRDGQSFAIAGLLSNVTEDDKQGVPLLSQLPVIGNLFKSKSGTKERTELMVLITPQLVRPLEPDEVPALPTDVKKFIPRTGVGSQLQGGGGLVDAPAGKPGEAANPPVIKKDGTVK